MSITDLRSVLARRGSVQRKYRWRANVSFPAGIVSAEDSRDVSILATTTTTPKQVLGEVLVQYGGREIPLPGDRKYEVISITFISTGDNFAHDAFELWSQQFNGDDSNTASASLDDLFADWTLELLDQTGEVVVKTYKLEDVWPQEVGELELDQASQDEYGQFTVNVRYFKSSSNNSR